MSEQQRSRYVPLSDVADVPDPGQPASVRDAYRARHRLAVSVLERAQQYRVSYSLGDLHRLTFLSHDERAAVRGEWQAWHRRYARLSLAGAAVWIAGASLAVLLWVQPDAAAGRLESILGWPVAGGWLTAAAIVISGCVLWTLPAFLSSVSAPALADAYLRGYADGMSRGVNRALKISPEMEREMWDELHEAERTDARWRQGTGPVPAPGRE